MPKLIAVLEPRSSDDIQTLLDAVLKQQPLPEGVAEVSTGVWTVEFPKCALFFSRLLVAADKNKYSLHVFEIANASEWEFAHNHLRS